ncbi:MAG: nitroreductase family protein [Elusimicrobia bacterium]|nr:nitroreductase family protein [Candidatus Liberimonas magnetica]
MDAKDLLKIIKERRSVRKYLPGAVPQADIEKLIEAATWAPSGGNLQNWHFVIVRSKTIKDELLKAINIKVEKLSEKINSPSAKKEYMAYSNYYTFFVQAPVTIAVVKKPYDSLSRRILERYGIAYVSSADVQGPSAAIQNILLMAHALGYATCWMTGPLIARKEIEEVLGIKEPDELMALIPVGKQGQSHTAPKRKNVVEVISYK